MVNSGRRRRIALAALITTATLVAASCSSGGGGEGPTTTGGDSGQTPAATGPGSGEITVLTWNGEDVPLKSVLPAFEKAYPDIRVNIDAIGYDDVSTRLNVGLQGGTDLPDVVSITTERIPTVIGTFPQGLTDLRTFGLGDEQKDWPASKWPPLTGPNGEIFGLPGGSAPVALYYRVDMLQEVGVDPADIQTWDDYLALGAKLKDKGIALFSFQTDNSQLYATLLQQLGESYFAENGDVNLASDNSIKVATMIQKAVQDGYGLPANNEQDNVAAYKNDKVATLLKPVWYAGAISTNVPEQTGKWGVTELPAITAGGVRASNQGGSNLVIPAKAKNPQAAYTFAHFAMHETSSAITMMKEAGTMPSLLAAFSDPVFDQPVEFFDDQPINRVFADTIPDIPSVPITRDYDVADQAAVDAMNRIVVSNAPVEQTLKDAASALANQIGQ